MNNDIEKITEQEKTRIEKIAKIVSSLPENEQEKIYYMLKGIELVSVSTHDSAYTLNT